MYGIAESDVYVSLSKEKEGFPHFITHKGFLLNRGLNPGCTLTSIHSVSQSFNEQLLSIYSVLMLLLWT